MIRIFSFFCLLLLLPGAAFAAPADAHALEEKVQALELELKRLLREQSKIPASLTSKEVRGIIDRGINWLIEMQEDTGHFRYEYLPLEDSYSDDDNIVRQTGALFILGEAARYDAGRSLDLEGALKKGADYFEELSIEGMFSGSGFRCVSENGSNCKLGAGSLALVGTLDFVTAYPEYRKQYESLIKEHAAYILAMQKESGGFRNVYESDQEYQNDKESSFSNGEAVFALARYRAYEQSGELDAAIDRALTYLESPAVPFDTALYLWIMAALKDVQENSPESRHVEYARNYTNWRIDGVSEYRLTGHNLCAYVEGLVSAYPILAGQVGESERVRYKKEIDLWLLRSADLEVRADDAYRVFYAENGAPYLGEIKNQAIAAGGFLTGLPEPKERIDFTQHCVSSYLQKLVDIDKEIL